MTWDFEKLKEDLRASERRHEIRDIEASGTVDIHTHVLPGVDDGAPNLEAAIAMLRRAHESGTRTVVVTPHLYHLSFGNWDPIALRRRFASFQEQVWSRSNGDDEFLREMTVALGAENVLGTELLEAARRREILTLAGGRHVLVELPHDLSPLAVEHSLAKLMEAAYVPVLAHVERYCHGDPGDELLKRLVGAGCVGQVNLASLTTESPWFRSAARLLREGLASVVASDGHDTSARPIGLADDAVSPSLRPLVEMGTTLHARRTIAAE